MARAVNVVVRASNAVVKAWIHAAKLGVKDWARAAKRVTEGFVRLVGAAAKPVGAVQSARVLVAIVVRVTVRARRSKVLISVTI